MIDLKWRIFGITFVTYSMIHAVRTSWSCLKYTLNSAPYAFSPVFLGTLDMAVLITLAVSLNLFGPKVQQFALLGLAVILVLLGCLLIAKIQATWPYAVIYPFAGVLSCVGWPACIIVFMYFKRGMIFSIWIGCAQFGDLVTLSISYVIVQTINANPGVFLLIMAALLVGVYFLVKLFLIVQPNQIQNEDIPEESPVDYENQGNLVQEIQRPSSNINMSPNKPSSASKKKVNFLTVWILPEVPAYLISYLFIKSVYAIILNWLVYYLSMIGMNKQSRIITILWSMSTFLGGIIGSYFNPQFKKKILIICLFASAFLFVFMEEVHLYPNEIQMIFLIVSCGLLFGGPYTLITTSIPLYLSERPAIKAFPGAKAAIVSAMEGYGLLSCGVSVLIIPTIGVIDMHWFTFSYCFIAATILLGYHLKELRQRTHQEKSKRYIMTQKVVQINGQYKFSQSLPNIASRKEIATQRQYKRKRLTTPATSTKDSNLKPNQDIFSQKESSQTQHKSLNIDHLRSIDQQKLNTDMKSQMKKLSSQEQIVKRQRVIASEVFKIQHQQTDIITNFQQESPSRILEQPVNDKQEQIDDQAMQQIDSQF